MLKLAVAASLLAIHLTSAHAASTDGTWNVYSKRCGAKELSAASEMWHISSNNLAVITVAESNDERFCRQVIGYGKLLTGQTVTNGAITEQVLLIPSAKRLKCYDVKNNNAELSDETVTITGAELTGEIRTQGLELVVRLNGTTECPAETLEVSLKR